MSNSRLFISVFADGDREYKAAPCGDEGSTWTVTSRAPVSDVPTSAGLVRHHHNGATVTELPCGTIVLQFEGSGSHRIALRKDGSAIWAVGDNVVARLNTDGFDIAARSQTSAVKHRVVHAGV